ncbi:MAG: hypothetical protein QOH57_2701 [Mycobacterium sp.]|jgi:methyltransferase (TIGR00027 family)|nr:hypothetical protein [Mycobacterium sp.]
MRTDNDTWDIATSVGSTAVMVAAARAAETAKPDALINDPFAQILVEGVGGTGIWQYMLDDTIPAKLADADPEAAQIFEYMQTYQGVRTHFFDAYFADAVAAGVRQIVILASGLDARAYRIDWPADTVLFEIDQPKVLEYKAATLDAHGAQPSVQRHEVAIDLRQDWPAALRDAGFDPTQPTAWLAEGLLMYLPAEAQDRLFEQITALSAPGSRISVETVGQQAPERREEMRERFERIADQVGIPKAMDFSDLTYDDPDRADVAEWLDAHGWHAVAEPSHDVQRRLGRHIELPLNDGDAFSTFVTAGRPSSDGK